MRALLIANPKATSISRRARDTLLRAFARDLRMDVVHTRHRGHATELATDAVDDYDVVIVLGGDGTINEVVNGLLAAGPSPDLPTLAIVPAGSANVLARALGLPYEALGAGAMVLDALRTGRSRTIGLGRADTRYFTFCAGLGFDAEVIHAVERHRDSGLRANPGLYVRAALRQFFVRTDRRRPALTFERSGHPPLGRLFLAIVSNTSPWTYFGDRPIDPNPRADFGTGLDLFALRRLAVPATLATLARMALPAAAPPRGPYVTSAHDMTEFTFRSHRPIAFQVDGDYLGRREHVVFRSVPKALRVAV